MREQSNSTLKNIQRKIGKLVKKKARKDKETMLNIENLLTMKPILIAQYKRVEFILSNKNLAQMRAVQGKRRIFFEIILLYIEKKITEV